MSRACEWWGDPLVTSHLLNRHLYLAIDVIVSHAIHQAAWNEVCAPGANNVHAFIPKRLVDNRDRGPGYALRI